MKKMPVRLCFWRKLELPFFVASTVQKITLSEEREIPKHLPVPRSTVYLNNLVLIYRTYFSGDHK
jgi:hypothetical protein